MQKYNLKARLQIDSDPKRSNEEMKELPMKERDIISAGLKIVGCFLVIQGVFSLVSFLIPVVIDFIRLPELVSALDSAAEMDPAQQRDVVAQARTMSSVAIGVRVFRESIRLIFGLYLCRGGSAIVRLLSKKQDS
jgi:hypothetical protein